MTNKTNIAITYMLTILILILLPSALAEGEYHQTINLQQQFGDQSKAATAYGVVSDDVDLFTGDVRFSMPIISLPGRNGMDLGFSVAYSSNVDTTRSNAESPTGVLGLGWSLPLSTITVDTKGTGSNTDDTFYWNGQELIPFPNQGAYPTTFYTSRDYTYKVITAVWSEPKIDHWIITNEDGSKEYYGSTDNSRWIALGEDNVIGVGDTNYYTGWYLDKREDTFGNRITYDYRKYETEYPSHPNVANANGYALYGSSQRYTKAMYLYHINDSVGRTVTFTYALKNPTEYYDPDSTYTTIGDTVVHHRMKRFERLYLDYIDVQTTDGSLLNRYDFGYNEDVNGLAQHIAQDTQLEKRLLTSVTIYDDSLSTHLNPTKFQYVTDMTFFRVGVFGKIQKVLYPSGGMVEYTYDRNDMNYDMRQYMISYGTQMTYVGNDFIVNKDVDAMSIRIKDFKGDTWKDAPLDTWFDFGSYPYTNQPQQYRTEVMDISTGKDYVAVAYGNTLRNQPASDNRQYDPKRDKLKIIQRGLDGVWRVALSNTFTVDNTPTGTGAIQVFPLTDEVLVLSGSDSSKTLKVFRRNSQLSWSQAQQITGLPSDIKSIQVRDSYIFIIGAPFPGSDYNVYFYQKDESGTWNQLSCGSTGPVYQYNHFNYGTGGYTAGCYFQNPQSQGFEDFSVVANDNYVAVLVSHRIQSMTGLAARLYRFPAGWTTHANLVVWRRVGNEWQVQVNPTSESQLRQPLSGRSDYASAVTFQGYFMAGDDTQLFIGNKIMYNAAQRLLRYTPQCNANGQCTGWTSATIPLSSNTCDGGTGDCAYLNDLTVTPDAVGLVTEERSGLGNATIGLQIFGRDEYGTGGWDFINGPIDGYLIWNNVPSPDPANNPVQIDMLTLQSTNLRIGDGILTVKAYSPINLGSGRTYEIMLKEFIDYDSYPSFWARPSWELGDYKQEATVTSQNIDYLYFWHTKDTNQMSNNIASFQHYFGPGADNPQFGRGALSMVKYGQIRGLMFHYPVTKKTVRDDYDNVITTTYTYKNGKFDKSLGSAQYNYVETSVQDVLNPDFNAGKTVYRFYNGLSPGDDACDVDCPDMSSFTYPDEMNSLLYYQAMYDSDNQLVQETNTTWEVTSKQLKSFEKHQTQTTTIRDHIASSTIITYNSQNGMVESTRNENGDNTVKTCTLYAFQHDPLHADILAANMLGLVSYSFMGNQWMTCDSPENNKPNVASMTKMTYRHIDDEDYEPIVPSAVLTWADLNHDGNVTGSDFITSQIMHAFDSFGNVLDTSDALGQHTYIYYGDGDSSARRRSNNPSYNNYRHAYPTAVKNALNHWVEATYDVRGNILQLFETTRQENVLQQNVYDGFSRLVKIIKPGDTLDNPTMQYTYHDWQQGTGLESLQWVRVSTKIDGSTHATATTYSDGLGREVAVVQDNAWEGNQVITTKTYNSMGQEFSATLPSIIGQTIPPTVTYLFYTSDPLQRVSMQRVLGYDETSYSSHDITIPGGRIMFGTDSCVGSVDPIYGVEATGKLKEYFCDDVFLKSEIHECGDGLMCAEGQCVSSMQCTDSDGTNYYTQGEVRSGFAGHVPNVYTDICNSRGELVEYRCDGQNVATTVVNCHEYPCTHAGELDFCYCGGGRCI
ncbi:MAG: SpvB/TcaC N-terminal domain-containing protein [archaeon]